MLVSPIALQVESLSDALTARQKTCRLLHQTLFSILFVNVRGHAELAHVPLHQLHVAILHQLLYAIELPGSSRPGMLVEEMLPPPQLVLVQQATKAYVLHSLCFSALEFRHPAIFVAVDLDVELLEQTEERAWGRPNDQKWVFFLKLLPGSFPVFGLGEVVAIGEVHG